jgi:hypothetical protein
LLPIVVIIAIAVFIAIRDNGDMKTGQDASSAKAMPMEWISSRKSAYFGKGAFALELLQVVSGFPTAFRVV